MLFVTFPLLSQASAKGSPYRSGPSAVAAAAAGAVSNSYTGIGRLQVNQQLFASGAAASAAAATARGGGGAAAASTYRLPDEHARVTPLDPLLMKQEMMPAGGSSFAGNEEVRKQLFDVSQLPQNAPLLPSSSRPLQTSLQPSLQQSLQPQQQQQQQHTYLLAQSSNAATAPEAGRLLATSEANALQQQQVHVTSWQSGAAIWQAGSGTAGASARAPGSSAGHSDQAVMAQQQQQLHQQHQQQQQQLLLYQQNSSGGPGGWGSAAGPSAASRGTGRRSRASRGCQPGVATLLAGYNPEATVAAAQVMRNKLTPWCLAKASSVVCNLLREGVRASVEVTAEGHHNSAVQFSSDMGHKSQPRHLLREPRAHEECTRYCACHCQTPCPPQAPKLLSWFVGSQGSFITCAPAPLTAFLSLLHNQSLVYQFPKRRFGWLIASRRAPSCQPCGPPPPPPKHLPTKWQQTPSGTSWHLLSGSLQACVRHQ